MTEPIPFRRRLLYLYVRFSYRLEELSYRLGFWRRPGIPHALKRREIRRYARRFGLAMLVETGTYRGDMAMAMARHFRRIYTIELEPSLYAKARARFARKTHVTVLNGDSAVELRNVAAALEGDTLFWLDAHYSGGATARGALDTPIAQELREIFRSGGHRHVVLIDDARCFDGTSDYPTVDELRRLIGSLDPAYSVEVRDDIIRVTPPP